MAGEEAGPAYGDPGDETQPLDTQRLEAKVAFHLGLRARGVRDLAVLRAMERVPRRDFVDGRHAGLVARDLAVPLAGGQTASPAWLIAALIEAAGIEAGQRVLEVGAGSGYGTAILAQLGATVVALERVRGLADRATARLAATDIADVDLRWADGSAGTSGEGRYDRILVHARCDLVSGGLLDGLAGDGRLVCARATGAGQGLVRIGAGGEAGDVASLPGCRLSPLRPGLLDL